MKIPPSFDEGIFMVEVTDSNWNLILHELIEMSNIVERSRLGK
jgi:hypothetical protein